VTQATKVFLTFLVGWVSEGKRFGIVLMDILNARANKVNFSRCIHAIVLFDKLLCFSPQVFKVMMLWITGIFSLDCTRCLNSIFKR